MSNNYSRLMQILNSLRNSSLEMINTNSVIFINAVCINILEKKVLSNDDLDDLNIILNISNILYNNTDKNILPLNDGIYDIALEKYKSYRNNFQVGAEPIHFDSTEIDKVNIEPVNAITILDEDYAENMLFKEQMLYMEKPQNIDFLKDVLLFHDKEVGKRNVNISHEYPELVGTLDKCKFVLDRQARDKGVFNDSNVKIIERDFFQKHLELGIINQIDDFDIIASFKYDGVSVEATITDKVLSARTRGDANEDIAADVTDILKGYLFPRATGVITEPIGVKFEAIMTTDNLIKYNEIRGKQYKNCRTAIISIFGSSDGWMFRDFITLVPLATSLGIDRLEEIDFMNKYLFTGVEFKWALLRGNYVSVLFQVKKFVEEAEYLRYFFPFMYDGVVIEYINPYIKKILSRQNAINLFAMAVKFNPLKQLTTVIDMTYTVGQDGTITPMVHYLPVEFYGTIHNKSSLHSYDRFKQLGLRFGDVIEVEYTNDVMPYVYKPYNSNNENNNNPLYEFITVCPSCGKPLSVTKTGKSVLCTNINCREKNIKRVASLMKKLYLKDFAESTISLINKFKLTELLNLKKEDISYLGDVNSTKFIERINELKTNNIKDYVIVGALGFSNIGQEKWKLILTKYSIADILNMTEEEIRNNLITIKGIGNGVVETIITELDYFRDDLITISNMPNIITSKGAKLFKTIRFSGVRDKEFMKYLCSLGYDATEGNVNKKTNILLIPYEGFTSSKTNIVGEDTLIVPSKETKENLNKYL